MNEGGREIMVRQMNPLISIVTPTYNAAKYISETIHSVKQQIYQNWEMILVDDCSTDETREIIWREIKYDDRFHLIELTKNGGPSIARNKAIEHAKGDYLAFLDSDDLWLPQKLEKQVAFMMKNKLAFSFTKYRMMTEEGIQTNFTVSVPQKISYKHLLKNTTIGTLTVMLDKRKVGNVQMVDDREISEDFALWLSILGKGFQAYGLDEELALYRKCEQSLSSNKLHSAKKTWNTYRKMEKINFLHALWYFTNYSFHAYKKHAKTFI